MRMHWQLKTCPREMHTCTLNFIHSLRHTQSPYGHPRAQNLLKLFTVAPKMCPNSSPPLAVWPHAYSGLILCPRHPHFQEPCATLFVPGVFFVFLFLRYAGLSLLWPLPLRSAGSGRAGSVAMAHGPSRSAACGILPDRGTNPCPLHRQVDSQPLRHQGSLKSALMTIFVHCSFFCS